MKSASTISVSWNILSWILGHRSGLASALKLKEPTRIKAETIILNKIFIN
jgi:hypothetical protein